MRRRPCGRSAAPSRCDDFADLVARLAAQSPRRRRSGCGTGSTAASTSPSPGRTAGTFTDEDLRTLGAAPGPAPRQPGCRLRLANYAPAPDRARRDDQSSIRHHVRADVLAAARTALADRACLRRDRARRAGPSQRRPRPSQDVDGVLAADISASSPSAPAIATGRTSTASPTARRPRCSPTSGSCRAAPTRRTPAPFCRPSSPPLRMPGRDLVLGASGGLDA